MIVLRRWYRYDCIQHYMQVIMLCYRVVLNFLTVWQCVAKCCRVLAKYCNRTEWIIVPCCKDNAQGWKWRKGMKRDCNFCVSIKIVVLLSCIASVWKNSEGVTLAIFCETNSIHLRLFKLWATRSCMHSEGYSWEVAIWLHCAYNSYNLPKNGEY